jgi:RNA polymerase sigma factor (sigma-70 family)
VTIRKHAPALAGATDLGIVLAGEPPEESFSAFFRRTYRNLVGYLLVSGVPFDLAEEAAQEAMIAAYRRWDDLANPGAWVRKVADRRATRHAVVRRRQLGTLSDGAGHGEPTASSSVSASAEEKDWILETLARLPPGQRATMALFFDQYSTVEIAKRLGTTQANVRSNLRHARYKLRQLLQDHHDAGTPAATHHREGQ